MHSTPIPLKNDTVYPATQPIPNGNTFMAPVAYNGSLYWLVGEVDDNITSPTTFALYKSIDGLVGANIVRVGTGPLFGEGYTCRTLVGSTLYFGFLDYADPGTGTGTFKVGSVDLATGAFGASNSTAHTVVLARVTSTFFIIRPNGDFVIAWDEYAAGNGSSAVYAMVYHAAAWSSRVTVSTTTFATIQQITNISVSNATGILWAETNSGEDLISLRFSILTAAAITGTSTALADASKVFGDTWYPLEPSLYDAGNDTVVFPIVQNLHASNIQKIDLLLGAPSAAPTWITSNVVTGDNSNTFDMPQIVATDTGFTMMWINHLTFDVVQQSNAVAIGTWSTPTTFYDEGVNPIGAPVIQNLGLFSLSINFINSQLAVSIGPYATIGGHTWCGVQYFFPLSSSGGGLTGPGSGYVFEIEKGVGRLATYQE